MMLVPGTIATHSIMQRYRDLIIIVHQEMEIDLVITQGGERRGRQRLQLSYTSVFLSLFRGRSIEKLLQIHSEESEDIAQDWSIVHTAKQ